MKKVFVSILAIALTCSAFAAETAKAKIQLTSSNPTYGKNSVELKENSDRNATYESGYDAESMMSQANPHSVLVYGLVGTTPCASVATDNLDGVVLGFKTNLYDTDYKLVFSGVSGRALKILDRVTNELIDVTEGSEYAFSVEAAQVGRVAVDDRFVIGGTPVVSFCFNYNVLEVFGHAGESLVVKQGDTEIANVPALGGAYTLDLNAYTGRLVVTLNGTDYQIDANPAVEKVNP